jgi:hypothetical protein
MTHRLVLVVTAAIIAGASAQDKSSKQDDDPSSFEIEPPLLIPYRETEPLPEPTEAPEPDVAVARLEKKLGRAQRNAARTERLYRIGALARVEVEQLKLRVVHLESDLADARLARAKADLAAQQSQMADANSRQDLEAATIALARAIEAAHAAKEKLKQAELDAAEANVRRQKKLLALGSARKSDVARAEQKLVTLKQNDQ